MASRLGWVPVLSLLALLVLPAGARAADPEWVPELIADIAPDSFPGGSPRGFLRLGNRAVFLDNSSNPRPAIWATDGTAAGTVPLAELCPACSLAARPLGATRNLAFFLSTEVYSELGETTYIWRTDGTPTGSFPVTGPLQTPQVRDGFPPSAAGDSLLYFPACTAAQGCELWSSDGTDSGTGPVADLAPGSASILVRELVTVGDVAYFLGRGPGGMGLWRADGRLRTISLVRALPTLPRPRLLTRTGSRLFFLAGSDGLELWTSDGTATGTRALTRFRADNPFAATRFLKEIDGRVYFIADDGTQGTELWSTDGTPGGLRRVTDFAPAMPFPDSTRDPFVAARLEKAGGVLLFPASHEEDGSDVRLWTTRGRLRTTRPLSGCPGGCPGAFPAFFAPLAPLAPLGSRVVFRGIDAAHGLELWISDGTGPGTRLLRDVVPGPDSAPLRALTPLGGRVYFERFVDQEEAGEIWATDGTEAGTHFLTRGRYGESHYISLPNWLPLDMAIAGGRAVFLGYDDEHLTQLWASDGTPAGTARLTARVIPASSWPTRFAAAGERVLFAACQGNETALWGSAGTAATTVRLLDINPEACTTEAFSGAVPFGGAAVFRLGESLWRSNGTPEGTVALATLTGSYIGTPVAVGNQVLFNVITSGTGAALWATDGTPAGTRKLVDLPGNPGFERAAGGLAYFQVAKYDGVRVTLHVWRSDGTAAGTFPITTFNGYPSAAPQPLPGFAELNGRVYFLTYFENQSAQLWSTDGTPGGTRPVLTSGFSEPENLEAEAGLLWFRARPTSGADRRPVLWRSDGTAAGTFPLPADLSNGVLTPYFTDRFVGLGSRVFFQATDPVYGGELWMSDGTAEGTTMVRDLFPGLADSHPLWMVEAGGRLWFSANGGEHGTELWTSDGTAEGTRRVTDIAPGALWSDPMWITPVGGDLWFSAEDPAHGREPWRIEIGD